MKQWKHNFRELVFKGNHTIKEIARQAGISARVLYAMNRDPYYNLTKDNIGKLCDFFKCTPGDLIISENDNHAAPEQGMLRDNNAMEYLLCDFSEVERNAIIKFCRRVGKGEYVDPNSDM